MMHQVCYPYPCLPSVGCYFLSRNMVFSEHWLIILKLFGVLEYTVAVFGTLSFLSTLLNVHHVKFHLKILQM